MNPDELQKNLVEKIEGKIFPINNYIPKLNEEIASIKALLSVDVKWEKRLEKDKDSDRIINKIRKSELSAKDLSLYLSLIELILEDKSELRIELNESYEKALLLKKAFMEKRQESIEKAKMILNGEKEYIINESTLSVKKIRIENPKVKKIKRRYRKLPKAYFARAYGQKNKIDYAIGKFLTEISYRGRCDDVSRRQIKKIFKQAKISRKKVLKLDSRDNLRNVIRDLKQANKEKMKANRNKNRWLVECLEIYQEMLVLRFRVEYSWVTFYRNKYMLIADYIQNSHLVID